MSRSRYIIQAESALKKASSKFYRHPGEIGEIASFNGLQSSDVLFSSQTSDLPYENRFSALTPSHPLPTSLEHTVLYGETLSSIAKNYLGDAPSWREIAQLNEIQDPDFIYVGQVLKLPRNARKQYPPSPPSQQSSSSNQSVQHRPATMLPTRAFFFIIADEFDPLRNKYVRKVFIPDGLQGNPELFKQILNPEKYGFFPRNPNSNVSLGRHVLGMTDSPFISVSEAPKGSPRFDYRGGERSKPYWIDVEKLKKTGVKIYDPKDIIRDLDRIAAKTKNREFLSEIERIKNLSTMVDKEIVIEGEIPAHLIKGAGSRAITRAVRVVEGVGIVLTIYDLGKAGHISYEKKTVRPLAAETVRQVGGWGSALVGFRLGASLGAAVGIETGPGALLTAAAGGLIGGFIGYFGGDWAASYIYDENE